MPVPVLSLLVASAAICPLTPHPTTFAALRPQSAKNMTVALVGEHVATLYAATTFEVSGGEWKRYEAELAATATGGVGWGEPACLPFRGRPQHQLRYSCTKPRCAQLRPPLLPPHSLCQVLRMGRL